MKEDLINKLGLAAILLASVIGCQSPIGKSSATPPFQISSNTNGYFVVFNGGNCSWIVDSNLLSMNLGVDSSVTFRLNPTNKELTSVLLELRSKDGVRYFLSDMNADGIPETRLSLATGQREALIDGRFCPIIVSGGIRQVIIDGITNEIVMKDGRWQSR